MAAHTQLAFEPVHQLRDRMTKGETSPVGLVEGYLDRIARYDAKLHAYIEVYADDARTAAQAAAAAIASGHRIGPFHGIPVAGSPSLRDRLGGGRLRRLGPGHFLARVARPHCGSGRGV